MVAVLYNDSDPYVAAWLEALIAQGSIRAGRVDSRRIEQLSPADCPDTFHAFAGIGGFAHALALAGWPDDVPIWTGSCPCQPFSSAGRGAGFDDPRHVWPAWFALIRERRPGVIVGEQVASKSALRWLDAVFDDLEGAGYACAAADLCAASVGAPHIRQRLYWVAIAGDERRAALGQGRVHDQGARGDDAAGRAGGLGDAAAGGRGARRESATRQQERWRPEPADGCRSDRLGDADGGREPEVARPRHARGLGDANFDGTRQRPGQLRRDESEHGERSAVGDHGAQPASDDGGLGNPNRQRLQGRGASSGDEHGVAGSIDLEGAPRRSSSQRWSDITWLPCRVPGSDATIFRPAQSGIAVLAHGVSGRMVVRRAVQQGEPALPEEHWYSRCGALRGIGNAIVPQLAAVFLEAVMAELGIERA